LRLLRPGESADTADASERKHAADFAESPDSAALADATPETGPQRREMVVQVGMAQLSNALGAG
jgi:hypothetical protein